MRLPLSAGVALLTLAASLAAAAPARAAYIVTFSQIGPDVVASGSGTIDINQLMFLAPGPGLPEVWPTTAAETAGAPGDGNVYTGVGGPHSFGPGGNTHATMGTGDLVGVQIIVGTPSIVVVPTGYVSGAPLSDTATYAGQSFATLGLTPGVYVYGFSGFPADTFTIDVAAPVGVPVPVPEPASLALLGTALLGFGLVRRCRARP